MTSSNLDMVRSICAAWEHGDFGSADWADPAIEFAIADGPDTGTWTGSAGMIEGWREWLSAWEEWRNTVTEYLELDDERVLVLFDASGRGKASGLELGHVQAKGATLFHIRDGRVTRLVVYVNSARALADVGRPAHPAA